MPKFNTIAVVGAGLIGASLAAAFKKIDPKLNIIAVDSDPETVKKAEKMGIADRAFTEIRDNLKDAELIFVAVPISKTEAVLSQIEAGSSRSQLIVDAGSTKKEVMQTAAEIFKKSSKRFIGGHPMAGSHNSGIDWHDPQLFEDAAFILTPLIDLPNKTDKCCCNQKNDILKSLSAQQKEDLLALEKLILKTGAKSFIISAEEHDYCTALVSHLPHLLSSALVNLLEGEDDHTKMLELSGGGFRDMTRIAGSSPALWQDIIMSNTDNLAELLDSYIKSLEILKNELKNEDEQKIFNFLKKAADLKKDKKS